jgi:hypothetical protein
MQQIVRRRIKDSSAEYDPELQCEAYKTFAVQKQERRRPRLLETRKLVAILLVWGKDSTAATLSQMKRFRFILDNSAPTAARNSQAKPSFCHLAIAITSWV